MASVALAPTRKATAVWPTMVAAVGTGAAVLAGFAVTLEVSTVKLAAVLLGAIVLPLLMIHVELGGIAFLALLWTRVSDVAVAVHGAPSIAAPFGLLLILASLARRIADGERIGQADLRPFARVAPYLAVVLGSVLWSEFPDRALASGIATLKDVLVFWILIETLRGPAALQRAIFVLVLAGGVLAGLNLHQYLTGSFQSDYGGFAQSDVLNIVGELDGNRLGGPLNSPNFFALILVVLVPLGLGVLRTRQPVVSRIAVVLALVTIGLTALLTFSRGGALVLMLVLGLSAIRHRLRLSHLALAGAVLVVVAALAPPTVWQRIETLAKPVTSGSRETGAVVDTSVELRLGAQQTALEIFLAHPFVGAGSGNFPPLYQDVSRRLGVKAVGTEYFPHNLYLEILAELGVVGLTAFAAMVYALWAGLRRSMPSAIDARASAHSLRELSFGIEAALVGYLAGMVLLQGSYPRYFWMLLALVVVATRASRDVARRPNAERVAGAGVAPRPARSFAGAPASTGSSGFGGNGEHQVKVPQASHDGSPDALVGGQQAGGCSDVSPAIAPIVLRATGPGRTAGRQEGRTVAPSLGRAYARCGLVIQRLARFQPIPSRLSVSRTVSSLTRSSGRLRSMLNLGDEIQCPRTRRHPVLGMMRLPSLTRWWDRARGPN